MEICHIQSETKKLALIIYCIYRPPSGNDNQFTERLDATSKYVFNPKSESLICCDMYRQSYCKQIKQKIKRIITNI